MPGDHGNRPPPFILPRIPGPVGGRAAAGAGSSDGARTARASGPPGLPAGRGSEGGYSGDLGRP